MHTHPPHQRIVSLPICHLHPHPDNAKRMSKANHENPDIGRSQKRLSPLCRMAEDCLAKAGL
jgi:hypothetical protein